MTLSRFFKLFIPLYLGCIPLVVVAIAEQNITEKHGPQAYESILGGALAIFALAAITPAVLIIWHLFLGKKLRLLFFWGKGKSAKKILKEGYESVAKIITVSDRCDGLIVTVNDQPVVSFYLQIKDKNNSNYYVSTETLISRADMPFFQKGRELPVRICNDDPDKIVFDLNKWQQAQKSYVFNDRWTDNDRLLVAQQGKKAKVKIIAVEDTGKSKNFQAVVKILFEVLLTNNHTYPSETEFPVPEDKLSLILSSKEKFFFANVHPHDKEKVIIDFSSNINENEIINEK